MSAGNINIAKIAKEFWRDSKQKFSPGCDIVNAVSLTLPLDIVCLSELSLKRVEQWLSERGVQILIAVNERPLHGFIMTHGGSGTIFINGTDTEEERRYTVAHETAHFLLDYKIPRDRAIEKLGDKIAEVLDGLRQPTIEERVDGILGYVKVRSYAHLLEKKGDGSFNSIRVYDSENYADELAIELLAPHATIVKELKENKKVSFKSFREKSHQVLLEKYKLPEIIAREYSIRLSYTVLGAPSLLEKLGF